VVAKKAVLLKAALSRRQASSVLPIATEEVRAAPTLITPVCFDFRFEMGSMGIDNSY
jgi:acetyl-CoA carboxylase beta subunit